MVHNEGVMLKPWLRYLWKNEDGFFGIGQGPNQAEFGAENALLGAGNFGIGQGEGDILASDNFFKAILSGDPAQISKVLGPTMSAINKQGQQSKQTASQFGNRGGGTNAFMQTTDDTTRSAIDKTIADLTGTAATSLGTGGRGLFASGISSTGAGFNAASTIQQQNANKWNDIFQSTAAFVAAPFTRGRSLGMGTLSKPGGGGGGNWWDNLPDYSNSSSGGGTNSGDYS